MKTCDNCVYAPICSKPLGECIKELNDKFMNAVIIPDYTEPKEPEFLKPFARQQENGNEFLSGTK
jgi:hypothetical protein